jgi:hypothetical protein
MRELDADHALQERMRHTLCTRGRHTATECENIAAVKSDGGSGGRIQMETRALARRGDAAGGRDVTCSCIQRTQSLAIKHGTPWWRWLKRPALLSLAANSCSARQTRREGGEQDVDDDEDGGSGGVKRKNTGAKREEVAVP